MLQLMSFPKGCYAHVRGIRFALAHKGYLVLLAVPFVLTLLLYGVGLGVFSANDDKLLALLWTPGTVGSGSFLGALYWLYVHVAKLLLYAIAFMLMYFLFMVVANILASPLYDSIAGRMSRQIRGPGFPEADTAGLWRTVLEEIKKAIFITIFPLLLLFVPVLGQFLAPLAAAALLAFDFLDFAYCRDEPRFAIRLRSLGTKPLLLLGFGLPLLIPLLNIALFPFAICSATLLYLDTTPKTSTPVPAR